MWSSMQLVRYPSLSHTNIICVELSASTVANMHAVVGVLAVLNMANSAYVYALRSTEYRLAFAKLLGCASLVVGYGATTTTKVAPSQTQQNQLTITRL